MGEDEVPRGHIEWDKGSSTHVADGSQDQSWIRFIASFAYGTLIRRDNDNLVGYCFMP